MSISVRPLELEDLDHVQWALCEAVSWDPRRELPPREILLEHPELARYHAGWGRPGDLGVLAEADGEVVGVAFCRRFTDSDHGHGYVDEETPELAIAVAARHRGRGLGTRLLNELSELVRKGDVRRLSLSVDGENPALRLYERLGYRELSRDDGGVRMVLDLA